MTLPGVCKVTGHIIEVLTIEKCDNCSPIHLGVFARVSSESWGVKQ